MVITLGPPQRATAGVDVGVMGVGVPVDGCPGADFTLEKGVQVGGNVVKGALVGNSSTGPSGFFHRLYALALTRMQRYAIPITKIKKMNFWFRVIFCLVVILCIATGFFNAAH